MHNNEKWPNILKNLNERVKVLTKKFPGNMFLTNFTMVKKMIFFIKTFNRRKAITFFENHLAIVLIKGAFRLQ